MVLLGFPLMMNMSKAVRKADLEYYAPRTDPGGVSPAIEQRALCRNFLLIRSRLSGSRR